MLAATAHDLRTPLTCLMLCLEGAPEAVRNKAARYCDGIRAIAGQGLELPKSINSTEPFVTLGLAALIDSLEDDIRAGGRQITWRGLSDHSGE